MLKKSFAPVIATNPKILILGSLPGDRSLKENEYYAHPQNRFWPIITDILNANPGLDYNKRIHLLQTSGICLWDVCETALRMGSMDTDILKETPNDISALLDKNRSIFAILFNGKKAEQLFDRYHRRRANLQYFTLPSTSPANARYRRDQLVQAWDIISELLRSDN